MNKKGQTNPMNFGLSLVIGFIVMFLIAVLGVNILVSYSTAQYDANELENVTEGIAANNSVMGLFEITEQATTIGIVIAIAIILLLVLGVFAFKGGGIRTT